MATYKVIQDIEAEDKLLGPLTLRQFIYGAVMAVCLYLSFLSIDKHAAFLLVIFLPIALIAGFFAFPWTLNQPTEVWALAKIRFLLKPRNRIWDQSGAKELVTITAPKQVVEASTNNLSQTEVKSRLSALADTIDSRGWVIKNVNLPAVQPVDLTNSDRLVSVDVLPQEVPTLDIRASDDILDEQNNPTAQHFEQMITASSKSHRQQIVQKLRRSAAKQQDQPATQSAEANDKPEDYWFLNQPQTIPAGEVAFRPQVVAPGTDDTVSTANPDDPMLTQELKTARAKPEVAYSNMHTLKPLQPTAPAASTPKVTKPDQSVTQVTAPGILNLANNNDLNIATIARQAKKKQSDGSDSDEVVISLR